MFLMLSYQIIGAMTTIHLLFKGVRPLLIVLRNKISRLVYEMIENDLREEKQNHMRQKM